MKLTLGKNTYSQIELLAKTSLNSNTTHILLIEDNVSDTDLITSHITKNGSRFKHSIHYARCLKDGIQLLSKLKIDIVLLNLSLPDSLGLDTFIKLQKSFPEIPIVVCTRYEDYNLGMQAVKKGAQDFISKENLSGTIIKRAIRYSIGRKTAQVQLEKLNCELDKKVKERTKQLFQEKQLVEEKNKEIMTNIHYAKHIQNALMCQNQHISNLFADDFVLNTPKNIVGGDFYWYHKIEDELLVAVADCTGHGVSGALLAINGWTQLNQIAATTLETDPSKILLKLNLRIKKSLEHESSSFQPKDGMDISICSINLKTSTLKFAGANRPIYIFRKNKNDKLLIKGNRVGIGSTFTNEKTLYKLYEVKIKKGDMIYLSTDGYADQFGGNENKKIMTRNLIKILGSIYHEPAGKQKTFLTRYFNQWKGKEEQTDDAMIVGIRI